MPQSSGTRSSASLWSKVEGALSKVATVMWSDNEEIQRQKTETTLDQLREIDPQQLRATLQSVLYTYFKKEASKYSPRSEQRWTRALELLPKTRLTYGEVRTATRSENPWVSPATRESTV